MSLVGAVAAQVLPESPPKAPVTRGTISSSSSEASLSFTSTPSHSQPFSAGEATNNNESDSKCNDARILGAHLASKNLLMERMSPASVDSGFDSSFPSSPDSSVDVPNSLLRSNSLKCLHAKTISLRCPLLVKEAELSLPCCSPSPSSCPSACSLPTSNATSPSSSLISNLESLDISSLKQPLSIVCDEHILELQDAHVELTDLCEQCRNIDVERDQSISRERGVTVPEIKRESSSSSSYLECPSTPSSSSCYIASDNNDLRSHRSGLRSHCHWDGCGERFACDNDLYDHVIKSHLEQLRPPECLSPGSKGRSSPKNRARNLMCRWGDCKMGMSRGDAKKQFIWLEDHFTTRHAGKAQPYPCLIEGCSQRFTLKRALEDHLRSGHEKAKSKRPHSEEDDIQKRKKCCLEWTALPYYPPDPKNDFLDTATEEWIIMRLKLYERTNCATFVPRPPPTPRGGAAYRKRRRILTFAIQPYQKQPEYETMSPTECADLLSSAFKRQRITASSESASNMNNT